MSLHHMLEHPPYSDFTEQLSRIAEKFKAAAARRFNMDRPRARRATKQDDADTAASSAEGWKRNLSDWIPADFWDFLSGLECVQVREDLDQLEARYGPESTALSHDPPANITSFFELRRTQRILRSSTTYRYLLHKLKQELPEARAELDELRRLLPDRAFDAEEDNTRVRMVRELRHCLHDAEAKRIKHLPSLLHDPSFQHLAKVLESHHPHLHELDSLMKMEEPEIKREPGVKREHYSDSEDSQPPHQGRRRRIHIKTEPAEDHSLGRVVLLSSRQQHNYQQRPTAGTPQCYNCGTAGHISRDCPNGPAPKKCYSCGDTGHISRECPQNPNAGAAGGFGAPAMGGFGGAGAGVCYRCGQPGHISRACPQNFGAGAGFGGQFGGQFGGGFGGKTCYSCGGVGHLSRECVNPAKCFACGGQGHLSRDCPQGGEKRCYNCGEGGHISRDCPAAAGGAAPAQ